MVVPLLQGITGGGAGLEAIDRESGVPEPEALALARYEVVTPFRLDLRTEPGLERGRLGKLEVYHDPVHETPQMSHRLHATPARIDPSLAPVVAALQTVGDVPTLLERVTALLPGREPAALRRASLAIVRIAAMKGFLRLVDEAELGRPGTIPSDPSIAPGVEASACA
ncbi:MAG: hypothetical protein R3B09_16545 [Nannocystaceae bacterium]